MSKSNSLATPSEIRTNAGLAPRRAFGHWLAVAGACWAITAIAPTLGLSVQEPTALTAGPLDDVIEYIELLIKLLRN